MVNVEKNLDKTLFCFTFNATLGDFRLCLVAEKMQENYRNEKFHVFMFELFNRKKERKKHNPAMLFGLYREIKRINQLFFFF